MSNEQVGPVYDRVIQDVCDSSRIDFEESGVDQHTLEELRKGWCQKLSSLGVAHFPWDPTPQPPPQAAQPAPIPPPPVTVPSNDHRVPSPHQQIQQQDQSLHAPHPYAQPSVTPEPTSLGDVPIKTENVYSPPPLSGPPGGTSLAQQRAATALHQKYGMAAANQVHHLNTHSQAALSLPGAQQRYQPQSRPQGPGQPAQNSQQISRNSSVENAQTDGAGDDLSNWKAEVQRRREAAMKHGHENDRRIRDYVESRGLQLEGNGLLAPLSERYPKKRKIAGKDLAFTLEQAEATETTSNLPPIVSRQYDGVDDYGLKKEDDDDIDDEDAINSDLDDPDELAEDADGDDDAVGQIMLCTYDKVQRVKSKWKCVLKDGILTTGGKEYVFHKGQGEFEWF
ncbi:transcription factor IIA subunit alpha [Myotisia sp. PD_48]|nr:transcription factor IIA subunit alpha [Myotisia sp. PD_48]